MNTEEFLKTASEELELREEAIEKIKENVERVKEAAINPNTINTITALTSAVAAVPILAGLASNIARSTGISRPGKASLDKTLEKNPDLKERFPEDKIKDYFDTIAHFAPNVASQPVAAGGILRGMLSTSTEAMDPQQISNLISMQEGRLKSTGSRDIPGQASTIADIARNIAK